jgi:hypothetical protein
MTQKTVSKPEVVAILISLGNNQDQGHDDVIHPSGNRRMQNALVARVLTAPLRVSGSPVQERGDAL